MCLIPGFQQADCSLVTQYTIQNFSERRTVANRLLKHKKKILKTDNKVNRTIVINKRSNLKTRPTVGPIRVGLQNIQNRTSIALSRHADLLRQRLLAENYPLFRTAKTDSSILFRVSLTHLLSAPKQWAGKAGSSPFSCSLHFFPFPSFSLATPSGSSREH